MKDMCPFCSILAPNQKLWAHDKETSKSSKLKSIPQNTQQMWNSDSLRNYPGTMVHCKRHPFNILYSTPREDWNEEAESTALLRAGSPCITVRAVARAEVRRQQRSGQAVQQAPSTGLAGHAWAKLLSKQTFKIQGRL